MLLALDHVNIRTARLAELRRFYSAALGLRDGARPPFSFGGAWLYCGDQAAVHLVAVAAAPAGREPRIEHFAFRAAGLADFLARLRSYGAAYQISLVPESGNRQSTSSIRTATISRCNSPGPRKPIFPPSRPEN